MIAQAQSVWSRAYAPYSKFPVSAAVRADSGAIYTGVNVENAAYPEGMCAEASAIANMVINDDHKITDVVVMGRGPHAVTPCGGCRQKIREFGVPHTKITMVDHDGTVVLERTLADLLPDSFGPNHLDDGRSSRLERVK